MVFKRFCLFLLSLAAINTGLAQQTNTVIPPSPDAAALGVYGSIPVSTYTGIPSISIPLYNLDFKDVRIPIDLSYHAAGVTVEQEASWVGLGWALNAGGVITRTVKGGDDMQFVTDGFSELGSVFTGYRGFPVDPGEFSGDYVNRVCEREIDPEPDIFYFNFLGKSGGFVLDPGQSVSASYIKATSLKAEKIDIRYDMANRKWQIRTADGFIYYFATMEVTETLHGTGTYGQGPEPVMFSATTNGFLSWDDIVVSSWYLDKVVSPLGEVVDFIYDTVNDPTYTSPFQRKYSLYQSARMALTDIKRTFLGVIDQADECYTPPAQTSAIKTFTNHIYLKEIRHSLGKIVFNKSLREDMMPATPTSAPEPYLRQLPFYMTWSQFGPQKLDNITMLDNAGTVIRKFELEYDYFNSQVTGNNKYNFRRLKLNRVRECSATECKPYYELSYEETHPLPSKFSNAQDFWGYYNGSNANVSRIPYGTYFYQTDNKFYFTGDSNRQPDGYYMTSGTLKKITYPTGGSSEFEFEPHDYFYFGMDAFAITDFSNNGPVGLGEIITAEYDPAPYQTITLNLTEPSQQIVIDGEMTYYPSATTSDPCNVEDPGITYVGNEVWYSLENTSASSFVVTHLMSDYLNYFIDNYTNNCLNHNTPENIDPIYRNKQTYLLGPGTYELKVYTRQKFNLRVFITKNGMPAKVIPSNGRGGFGKTAGGLRVKKITSKDNQTAVLQVKKYDYTEVNSFGQRNSTGRLLLDPIYHVPYNCQDGSRGSFSIMGRSWNSVPLGTSAAGSIVGYNKVTEFNEGNGRTEYYYRNEEEEPLLTPVFIEGFANVKRTSNGLMLDMKQFDEAGNILKTANYEYNRQLQKDIKGLAYKQLVEYYQGVVHIRCVQHIWEGSMVTQEYNIISDRWVPVKKTEKLYSPQLTGFVQTITDYDYDTQTHLQLKSEETTSSEGESVKTLYAYPPDASWIPTAMWQDKYMYDKVVRKEIFRNNVLNNTYKTYYDAQANTFLMNKDEVGHGTNALETFNTYSYSAKGNILETTGRDGIPQTYLWGYNNIYPIVHIKNATLAQVLTGLGGISEATLNSFADESTPSADYLNRINNLRSNLPNAVINSYTYKPLIGMTTESNANGLNVYYEYDNFGRLKLIRDQDNKILKKFEYQYQSPITQ